ncbi:sugar kinase [Porticoccaceae bacterium]|nr:sugar kinase [Porticoccaceae bacterium]
MRNKVAVIGECMLEVSTMGGDGNHSSLSAGLSFGGDTLNTAIYLARLGIDVDYVSALGDDDMSGWMLDQWRAEGVGCNLVSRIENTVPGLYLIQIDEHGERSFLYWRANSPATRLFDNAAEADVMFEQLSAYQHIYLSGISLAIYTEAARQRLFDFFKKYRAKGGEVIFDGNYRPRLWASPEVARDAYETMYRLADLVLPTDEDEALLFGAEKPDLVVARLKSLGASVVVLKMGENGCLIGAETDVRAVPAEIVTVVDSTAAGDSFNAGFMAARFNGQDLTAACRAANRLASVVIQHRGAIIPVDAMPA